MLEMSNRLVGHTKRVTIMPKDVRLCWEFVDALQPETMQLKAMDYRL
jgi:histone H3/H4